MINTIEIPWKAQANDLIGGWCITEVTEKTPADGALVIVDMCDEVNAKHIVELHNEWIKWVH